MDNTDTVIQNNEISLKELMLKIKEWVGYLCSQWKIIIIAGLVGAILGIGYSLMKKPVYTATLSFALEDEKPGGIGSALGLASSLGLDIGGSGGGAFSGANLTELLTSRSMVEKTLLTPVKVDGKLISLAEMYVLNNKWRDKWKNDSRFDKIKFLPLSNRNTYTRAQDSILGVIYKNLSKSDLSVVQKDKKISIINIDVSSPDELFAKYFCESLAKQVSDFYIDTKSKKARMNMNILERQTDSIRAELNSAITGVAVANDNTFNLNPALNVRRTPSSRRQVDVQANTAILTELVKQTELAKVTLRRETPLIQIIDSPILPLPNNKANKIVMMFLGSFSMVFFTLLYLILKRLLQ